MDFPHLLAEDQEEEHHHLEEGLIILVEEEVDSAQEGGNKGQKTKIHNHNLFIPQFVSFSLKSLNRSIHISFLHNS